MKLPLGRIAELIAAGGDFAGDQVVSGYSIDSRTIQPGELFFAVRGERLDGHDFVQPALEKGAAAAVIAKTHAERFAGSQNRLVVSDVLVALQTLGSAVRRIWGKTVIGVTGSAGKTTSKEAIAQVLSAKFRVLKSEGNLNNHFGLPLQLLRLEREHEIAVIEMGMSHASEIAALAKIAQPEIGVVTLVAPVHMEFFASLADVARAKHELIAALPPGGVAVLNADDPYVSQFGRDFHGRVVTFGVRQAADVRAESVEPRGEKGTIFTAVTGEERALLKLPLIGLHNVYNALAAIAVGWERGIALAEAAAALANLEPYDKRGQVLHIAGATVINDCYNSNPQALKSMVDALAAMPAKRRIVVAGEMLELGSAGDELHRECGRYIAQQKIDFLLGVQGSAQTMAEAAQQAGMAAEFVATPEEAGRWLARNVGKDDVLLLKASRGVKLEGALEGWKSATAAALRPRVATR